jgi:hypothetical protein
MIFCIGWLSARREDYPSDITAAHRLTAVDSMELPRFLGSFLSDGSFPFSILFSPTAGNASH